MPNKPKTPKVGWRIPEDVLEDLKWIARDNRETVTAVVVRALRREIRDHFVRRGRRGHVDED